MQKEEYIRIIKAFLFTFTGGFSNVYTYLYRGGIFSNMQTGNLIKFIISLSNGIFEPLYFVPIISFIIGCMVSISINKLKNSYIFNLIILFTIYLSCGFIPNTIVWNIIIVSVLAFLGAMMFESFNECLSVSYTSIMCTNNMRLLSSNVVQKNYKKALFYLSIIISFSLGCFIAIILGKTFDVYSISFLSIIFILCLVLDLPNINKEK